MDQSIMSEEQACKIFFNNRFQIPNWRKYGVYGHRINNERLIGAMEGVVKKLLPYKVVKVTPADGNCGFYGFNDQLEMQDHPLKNPIPAGINMDNYPTQKSREKLYQQTLRENIVAYMRSKPQELEVDDGYQSHLTWLLLERGMPEDSCEDMKQEHFEKYLYDMSQSGKYADEVVMIAASKYFKRDIYSISARLTGDGDFKPWIVFKGDETNSHPPILLGQGHDHFQSLVPLPASHPDCRGCGEYIKNTRNEHFLQSPRCLRLYDAISSENDCVPSPIKRMKSSEENQNREFDIPSEPCLKHKAISSPSIPDPNNNHDVTNNHPDPNNNQDVSNKDSIIMDFINSSSTEKKKKVKKVSNKSMFENIQERESIFVSLDICIHCNENVSNIANHLVNNMSCKKYYFLLLRNDSENATLKSIIDLMKDEQSRIR